jgi:hypothetical protein
MVTAETVIGPLTSRLYETDGSFALMNQDVNNFVMNAVSFIFVCEESENANNISLCCNTDTGTE